MRMTKLALSAIALVVAAGLPASADPTYATGYNNGDAGVITLAVNAGVTSSADSTNNPVEGLLNATCEYHQITRPSSNDVVLVVQGHAVAAPRNGHRAVAVTVTCVLKNLFTGSTVYNGTFANEGMAAVWVPQTQGGLATSYRVCAESRALYADGSYVVTDQMHCI